MSPSSVVLLLANTLFYYSHIEEIKQDVESWKNSSRWDDFWSREKITAAIAKHHKNLDDCCQVFLVSSCNIARSPTHL